MLLRLLRICCALLIRGGTGTAKRFRLQDASNRKLMALPSHGLLLDDPSKMLSIAYRDEVAID
jgi:hypothetical protein